MLPEAAVYQYIRSEVRTARTASRTSFVYVALTSKEVMPMWLPPEAVGAKFQTTPMVEAGSSDLSALNRALRAASTTPRMFRTVAQWSTCFWRFAHAAVTCEMWSWAVAVTYHDTITRLVEETSTEGPYLGIVYDDLQRRSWAARAERGDATLDMVAECQKADEHILGQARTRLHGLLAEAGIQGRGSPVAPTVSSQEQAMANQLAQQRAATESMMKRTAEASRDLMASADANRLRSDALGAGAPPKGRGSPKAKARVVGSLQNANRNPKIGFGRWWPRKAPARASTEAHRGVVQAPLMTLAPWTRWTLSGFLGRSCSHSPTPRARRARWPLQQVWQPQIRAVTAPWLELGRLALGC